MKNYVAISARDDINGRAQSMNNAVYSLKSINCVASLKNDLGSRVISVPHNISSYIFSSFRLFVFSFMAISHGLRTIKEVRGPAGDVLRLYASLIRFRARARRSNFARGLVDMHEVDFAAKLNRHNSARTGKAPS